MLDVYLYIGEHHGTDLEACLILHPITYLTDKPRFINLISIPVYYMRHVTGLENSFQNFYGRIDVIKYRE